MATEESCLLRQYESDEILNRIYSGISGGRLMLQAIVNLQDILTNNHPGREHLQEGRKEIEGALKHFFERHTEESLNPARESLADAGTNACRQFLAGCFQWILERCPEELNAVVDAVKEGANPAIHVYDIWACLDDNKANLFMPLFSHVLPNIQKEIAAGRL